MKTRQLLAVAALVAAALIVIGLWRTTPTTSLRKKPSDAGPKAEEKVPAKPRPPAPRPELAAQIRPDDDPIGTLRLEGQVVDEAGAPVASALVVLHSNPTRRAIAEEDGTFFFDKLIGRRYALEARLDDLHGGPLRHQLTATSDPVVIRMVKGIRVEITTVDSRTQKPIQGARVGLFSRADDEKQVFTDADGKAMLRGVRRGQAVTFAQAKGYARASQLLSVGEAADLTLRQVIALKPAGAVTGRVVSESGEPISGAHVQAEDAVTQIQLTSFSLDAVETAEDGSFALPAVAPGTHRIVATHRDHAPASSDPVEIDQSGKEGITITMTPGGVLAGRVITDTGAPVAWATVTVAGALGEAVDAPHRRTTAEEDGTFRIQGLTRNRLSAFAQSADATSEVLAVDLRSRAKRENVVVRLTVDGAIAGRVVDSEGEPVSDARVHALPDFAAGADFSEIGLRGVAQTSTDGDGGFRLTGLKGGAYRLHATRTTMTNIRWELAGTPAKTGQSNVQILLAAEGGLKGKILLSTGSAPKVATVSVGMAGAGVPAVKGEFAFQGLPPGNYDVTLRGPRFPDKTVPDVKIEPSETTDIGTITVARGRFITGRVVDESRRPIEGATVVAAQQIVTDGKGLSSGDLGTVLDARLGVRRTTTDQDGAYVLTGVNPAAGAVAADHPERGISYAKAYPAGDNDVPVNLTLAPPGQVTGTVTVNGEPGQGLGVRLTAASGAPIVAVLKTDKEGKLMASRVAPGKYKAIAVIGSGLSPRMSSAFVKVPRAGTGTVDIDVKVGDITLAIAVNGKDGAKIDVAQVFLFAGKVRLDNASQLRTALMADKNANDSRSGFAFHGKTLDLDKLIPGSYSACIIPINGDMSDQTFTSRLNRHADQLRVYCSPVQVESSPAQQRHVAVTPQMSPLPEETK